MSQQPPTIGERVAELLSKHTELTTGQVAAKLGDCSPKQASGALSRLRTAGHAISECRDGVYFWRFADPADAAAAADDPMPDPAPFAHTPPARSPEPRDALAPTLEPASPPCPRDESGPAAPMLRIPITVGEMLDYAHAECLLDAGTSMQLLDAFAQGIATAEKHHGITG